MSEIDLSHYETLDAPVETINVAQVAAKALSLPELVTDDDGAPIFKSMDEAVRVYIEHRNALKSFMAHAKLVEDSTKADLAKVSMWMRQKGDELGIDSFKTQYGTAFRNVKVSYRMGDWNQFIEWVKATDNFQCLEKRVAKLSTKEIHDETGEIPPGIDYSAEVEFDVRSPIKRKV